MRSGWLTYPGKRTVSCRPQGPHSLDERLALRAVPSQDRRELAALRRHNPKRVHQVGVAFLPAQPSDARDHGAAQRTAHELGQETTLTRPYVPFDRDRVVQQEETVGAHTGGDQVAPNQVGDGDDPVESPHDDLVEGGEEP